jgi:hypothetical protein
MRILSNIKYIGALSLTAAIGMAAGTAFGQDMVVKQKDKAPKINKERSFCSSGSWNSDDRVSYNEVRDMTVSAGGTINVDGGQNGGISVKGEDRSDVVIKACVQTWGTSDEAAKAAASNIRIATGPTIKADSTSDDKNWSVSYQISVPRSTNLSLTAHNGGISISGVDGTADFQTTNGGVNLSNVSGNVKGKTQNGGVNVLLSGNAWKGSGLEVATQNGGVNIVMPENYAARVETGTVNGGYNTDFAALAAPKSDERGPRPKRVSADLNGGGAPIRITTHNGGVRIISSKD